tara:strand:- start:15 stop:230 length:216 start_codon:yes stop_codon:yes gene_type:complete
MWFSLFKSDYKIRSHTLTKKFAIPTDFVNTFGFQRTDPLGILIKEEEKEVWILHNPDSEYYEDLIKEVNRL